MGVRSIAVRLGDNDFGNTFRPLLQSVMRAIEHNGELTKEQAAWMIRDGIAWHYNAFQGLMHGSAADERLIMYLQGARILFDDEACADSVVYCDGGAWFLNVEMGEVYSY